MTHSDVFLWFSVRSARRSDVAASEVACDAVRKPRKAAVPVVTRGLRRASKSFADALHRLQLFSCPKAPGDNPYASLSALLGIIACCLSKNRDAGTTPVAHRHTNC